jgi:hypothetical protein
MLSVGREKALSFELCFAGHKKREWVVMVCQNGRI